MRKFFGFLFLGVAVGICFFRPRHQADAAAVGDYETECDPGDENDFMFI